MTAPLDTVEGQLQSLRRFFLLRYQAEVERQYPAFAGVFPLVGGSRLDLIRVNGTGRVHFVYRGGTFGENLVVLHDLMLEVGASAEDEERRLVLRSVHAAAVLAHFVLHPPYQERFDEVEQHALEAVARHARMPISS